MLAINNRKSDVNFSDEKELFKLKHKKSHCKLAFRLPESKMHRNWCIFYDDIDEKFFSATQHEKTVWLCCSVSETAPANRSGSLNGWPVKAFQ